MTEETKSDETEREQPELQDMQTTAISPEQIAASSGVVSKFLSDPDLKVTLKEVPAIQIIGPILGGLASGQIAIVATDELKRLQDNQKPRAASRGKGRGGKR